MARAPLMARPPREPQKEVASTAIHLLTEGNMSRQILRRTLSFPGDYQLYPNYLLQPLYRD